MFIVSEDIKTENDICSNTDFSINSYITNFDNIIKVQWQKMELAIDGNTRAHYKAGINKPEHTSNGHEDIIVKHLSFLV